VAWLVKSPDSGWKIGVAVDLSQILVLGISSSALFDARKEDEIFSTRGLDGS